MNRVIIIQVGRKKTTYARSMAPDNDMKRWRKKTRLKKCGRGLAAITLASRSAGDARES